MEVLSEMRLNHPPTSSYLMWPVCFPSPFFLAVLSPPFSNISYFLKFRYLLKALKRKGQVQFEEPVKARCCLIQFKQ